jgi:hypothetical protein
MKDTSVKSLSFLEGSRPIRKSNFQVADLVTSTVLYKRGQHHVLTSVSEKYEAELEILPLRGSLSSQ